MGAKSVFLKLSSKSCKECLVPYSVFGDLNSEGVVDQIRVECKKHGTAYRMYQASRMESDGQSFLGDVAKAAFKKLPKLF